MIESSPSPIEPQALDAKRRRWLYGAVAVGAATVGAGLAWWRLPVGESTDRLPDAFWNQEFPAPGGGTLRLASFQGKPLVLNFWATWCPPCVEEMPLLDRFFRENAAKSWNVIGLAVDRAEPVSRFLRERAVSFPVALLGMDGVELAQRLGDLSGGLPFTVVVGQDGVIVQRKMGRLNEGDLTLWAQQIQARV